MATNTYRGTPLMLEQRRTESYNPNSGYTREYEYRGLSQTNARVLAGQFAKIGGDYNLTVSHGISTLVATDTSGGYVLDTWEIGANEVSVSSFQNPRNANKLLDLSSDDSAVFLDGVANRSKWNTVYAKMSYTNPNGPALERAFMRFLKGSDSYFAWQYVVRHTTNVASRYPYNIADDNVGCIYTPAQFYSEVQSSGLWLYPMPAAFVNTLTANPVPNAPVFTLWGYLKGASQRHTAANNRTNIVTEYNQFLWSTDEYATVS